MVDLQPIITKITEDADAAAAEITEKAKQDADSLYAEYEQEKVAFKKQQKQRLDKEIEKIYEIEAAKNKQIIREGLLRVKADSISAAVRAAAQKIAELPAKEYAEVLSGLYEKVKNGDGGIIYLSAEDKERLGAEAQKIFAGAEISDSTVKTNGGFILSYGKIEYDCTIGSIFADKYNAVCDKINTLYEEEG